jgi:DNA-binding CsgD family transcriptional regulator
MSLSGQIQMIPAQRHEHAELCEMIDTIGDVGFSGALLRFLKKCGAAHCGLFELSSAQPRRLLYASYAGSDVARRQIDLYLQRQYWRYDPCVAEAERMIGKTSTVLIRQDISDLSSCAFRSAVYDPAHVQERLFVCRSDEASCVALSMLRSDTQQPFQDSEISYISSVAETLFSVLGKHVAVIAGRASMTEAFVSLDEIERCVAESGEGLTGRESQVCTRILYGLSAAGISSDLKISEETISTYRKRAYQRLGIATRQELLMWYLGQWRAYDLASRIHTEAIPYEREKAVA